MITFDQFKRGAAVLADTALKTGTEIAERGKKQVDLMALRTKLSKAQRELGALVYSLHKNGEENPELVEKYIRVVASVEAELAASTRRWTPLPPFVLCAGTNCNGPRARAWMFTRRKKVSDARRNGIFCENQDQNP